MIHKSRTSVPTFWFLSDHFNGVETLNGLLWNLLSVRCQWAVFMSRCTASQADDLGLLAVKAMPFLWKIQLSSSPSCIIKVKYYFQKLIINADFLGTAKLTLDFLNTIKVNKLGPVMSLLNQSLLLFIKAKVYGKNRFLKKFYFCLLRTSISFLLYQKVRGSWSIFNTISGSSVLQWQDYTFGIYKFRNYIQKFDVWSVLACVCVF